MAFKKAKAGDKPMTKAQIIQTIADETQLKKKDVAMVIESLVELAYAQAPVSFTIPGLGKLVVSERKARMQRNPRTGEMMKVPAKKVLKFRVAKAAKDAVLGQKNKK
ncbi:MAG: HU family DNA-binding protein [Candidatus Hydrogenedentes bacterium]|nr:HU family DNA-binding protein [Candidatus Hydrogenedentota bacterium]